MPSVRQTGTADCGAAALTMALRHHGHPASLLEVRKALNVGRDGSTAAQIIQVAAQFGLEAEGMQVSPELLHLVPAGSVLHWDARHFVVLDRVTRRAVFYNDPAFGRRSISRDAVAARLSGAAIVFTPLVGYMQPRRKSRIVGVMKHLLAERKLVTSILGTATVAQIIGATVPLITAVLLDRVVPNHDVPLLILLAVGFTTIQVAGLATNAWRARLMLTLRQRLDARLSHAFMRYMVTLPFAFFQSRTSGELLVRAGTNDAVREIVTSTFLSAVVDGTTASVYLVLLVAANAKLTIYVMVFAAARLVVLASVRARQRHLVADSMENQSKSQSCLIDLLNGIESLKAMGLERSAIERWIGLARESQHIAKRRAMLEMASTSALSGLGVVSTLIFLFYGSATVMRGEMSVGTMMAFVALSGGLLGSLNNLVNSSLQVQMLDFYLERIDDVVAEEPEQSRRELPIAHALQGEVAVESVSFRYPGTERYVLEDVSFTVRPGMRVALVGRSGSGKSTLAKLVAGLYQPNAGRICFDGVDLRAVDLDSLRRQFGYVSQDIQLFGTSILRNISMDDPTIDLESVVFAAKAAGIHDDIALLPASYDTVLADRGLSMSGGQRQRIALARALARKPALLILDEATSHLDSVTECRVQEALNSFLGSQIIIAQRLITIIDVDLILVVAGGRVVASGTHQELIAEDGLYADLVTGNAATREDVRTAEETNPTTTSERAR